LRIFLIVSRLVGGKPFSRGALYLILQNRIYRGEIVHNGRSDPGEHPPIIDQPSRPGARVKAPTEIGTGA